MGPGPVAAGYRPPAVAASQPPAVQQSYNGYLSEFTDSGHIHAQPYIQWKALWDACSYTHACGTGIANVAGSEASTTYTEHRNQQIAEPKAPLWEVLLAPYAAAAVAAAGVEVAGPAYALSVRVSAWWLTLGAGGGAAATEAMSGNGGYADTTARTGAADTRTTAGDAQAAKITAINFRFSEIRDVSENVNQTVENFRGAFTTQPAVTGEQQYVSGYVNGPITPFITAAIGGGAALSETKVPQIVMTYMAQAPWLAPWRGVLRCCPAGQESRMLSRRARCGICAWR